MAENVPFIEHRGTRMYYCVSGPESAPPIVLMHGWGCNSSTLLSVAAVAEKTHRVYNVDFPGHGMSPEPAEVWGVDDYTDAIEQLVKKEGLRHPALLGHSFGGRVGILYASRHPQDVSRLVLVDAAGIKPRRSLGKKARIYAFKALKNLLVGVLGRQGSKPAVQQLRRFFGSSDYASASPKMQSILAKVVNEDLTERLPLIQAPTLLLWGTADTATPMRDARLMERSIPGAKLRAFEGAGHYSFLDNRVEFARELALFLSK